VKIKSLVAPEQMQGRKMDEAVRKKINTLFQGDVSSLLI